MRKSIILWAASLPNLTPGDFADLITRGLSPKGCTPEILRDVIRYAENKREEKQEELIPCLAEEP